MNVRRFLGETWEISVNESKVSSHRMTVRLLRSPQLVAHRVGGCTETCTSRFGGEGLVLLSNQDSASYPTLFLSIALTGQMDLSSEKTGNIFLQQKHR